MDERYCSNCRTLIPKGASACPSCGTYAGDVFDGKVAKPQRKSSGTWFVVLVLIAAAGGAAYWYWLRQSRLPHFDQGPIRVVSDRPGGARRAPGAALNEPEAMMTLRHYFARRSIRSRANAWRSSARGSTMAATPSTWSMLVVIRSLGGGR